MIKTKMKSIGALIYDKGFSFIEGANVWTPHSFAQGWKALGSFDVINERGGE